MNKPAKNLSASVHQRLLNKSRETNQPFNELIQYYGIERLLYRLSLSQYSRQFVLKGALMFKAWGMANFRPTRDVDLLGHALNTLEHIKTLFEDVCKLETEPDGLEFDKNVSVERIKEDAEYEGIRVNVLAHLDKTRIPVQVDIGFADVVTPAPQKMELPDPARFSRTSDLWVSARDHRSRKIPGNDRPRHGKQPHERFLRSLHDVRRI
jgi:hypothetical protein